jgi:hypothetical protein
VWIEVADGGLKAKPECLTVSLYTAIIRKHYVYGLLREKLAKELPNIANPLPGKFIALDYVIMPDFLQVNHVHLKWNDVQSQTCPHGC